MTPSAISPAPAQLICPDCGATCLNVALQPYEELRCRRCHCLIRKASGSHTIQTVWALSSTGLFLALLANIQPILTFNVAGNTQSPIILSGVFGLFRQGYSPVAALVFFGAVLGPFLYLLTVWYVSAACSLHKPWPGISKLLRLAEHLQAWNLIPVYAVAILVAVVKLDMLGHVEWQRGTLWILGMSLCSLALSQIFDQHVFRDRINRLL